MSLERIVRPFQAGDVFTARVVLPGLPSTDIQFSTDVPRLEWTGESTGQYDDVPSPLQLDAFTAEWTEDVSKRVTETVKITQDDNPDNFVNVDRMKSTVMTNEQTGRNFALKFADWDKDRKGPQ